MIKTISKKKKRKKAKWLSEEALQIVEKRREEKGKDEKQRYTHLNAEFQRIARRDKKAFLSDQCKEIEENIRMGKTRDLCWEPAQEIPPMTRSCGRDLMSKADQDSRDPLDLLKHLPQNQNLSVLLFCAFHQLF